MPVAGGAPAEGRGRAGVIIGIDLDNTLICYDRVFPRAARAFGVPAELVTKTEIRDYLRGQGREQNWVELQGVVYGVEVAQAELFAGADAFLASCRQRGWTEFVISHKTRVPGAGPPYDLHEAAGRWLQARLPEVPEERIFFELTRQAKLERIAVCGCQVFIDDLPELFAEPDFPSSTRGILFDPADLHAECPRERARSWAELTRLVGL